MKIAFTKMQGAGNDFVVLDETKARLNLSVEQYRHLADRHFGVGADQILSVRPAPADKAGDVDFQYIIHNADGGEVEQCGNGARCFVRFVHEQGLSPKRRLRVLTRAGVIEPELLDNGDVRVDMGQPVFQPERVPFKPQGLVAKQAHQMQQWAIDVPPPLRTAQIVQANARFGAESQADICVLSMGNPHAVLCVHDVQAAPVATWGAWLEAHPFFPQRVNVGFMQVQSRSAIALRVFERGAGETLACGTGACAAVVAGIQLGLLDKRVSVQTQGAELVISWNGLGANVWMQGPAKTVYRGEIEL